MSASSFTIEELIVGIGTLPQEIYDMIQALVLSLDDEPYVRIIDCDYRQPVQLQLNRKIRSELVQKYYGDGAIWSTYLEPADAPETYALWHLWWDRPATSAMQGSFAQWADSRSTEVKEVLWEAGRLNMFYSPHDKEQRHWHVMSLYAMESNKMEGIHLVPFYCFCERFKAIDRSPA